MNALYLHGLPTRAEVPALEQLRRSCGLPLRQRNHGWEGNSPKALVQSQDCQSDHLQSVYDSYVADSQARLAAVQDAHYTTVASLNAKLAVKERDLNQLRRRNRLSLRLPSLAAQRQRLLYGGTSNTTRNKLAKQVETLLSKRFATSDARKQALYEHFLRNPSDYNAITNEGTTRSAFDKLCQDHPEWLIPIQQDVLDRTEEHWTLPKCLSIQIHYKVGSSERYQRAINILGKNYSESAQKWIRKELYEGTGLYIPLLKSKNSVTGFRDSIVAENPIIQDENGTAVWVHLDKLVEEAISDDRAKGYQQTRRKINQDTMWLHWSGDAAGWIRGLNHSKFGFKLVGNGRVVAQSPSNMKCALIFEGKDKYQNYKEVLAPIIPVIAKIGAEGVTVCCTHYAIKQTLGADYALLAEVMGHSGASATNGCCLCDQHKKDYGKIIIDAAGRRVPLKSTPRTVESMAAATHRPLTTGPDVQCPYCLEPFPNQAAVNASVGPATEGERDKFQLTHKGMRFGTPPLLPDFSIALPALCILHWLLRISAIVFQRTILMNLDTAEKVEQMNDLTKKLHLGCKKLVLRKTSGERKKDTESIGFTGR
jgi:hypothetical protein